MFEFYQVLPKHLTLHDKEMFLGGDLKAIGFLSAVVVCVLETYDIAASHGHSRAFPLSSFSLVLRPSLPPVFDRLQYAKTE